jgi:hypothetical protein
VRIVHKKVLTNGAECGTISLLSMKVRVRFVTAVWRLPLKKQLTNRFRCDRIVAVPWVISSDGRAPALQAGCRQFDPVIAHHVAQ